MIQSNQETRKPELAVIIPIYNEAENILSLLDEISLSLSGFVNNYEIICVMLELIVNSMVYIVVCP